MLLCQLQVHPSQGSVRTMTVEEGHVLNIDGTNANKYKVSLKYYVSKQGEWVG